MEGIQHNILQMLHFYKFLTKQKISFLLLRVGYTLHVM